MRCFPQRLRSWTALLVTIVLVSFDVGPAVAGLMPSRASEASSVITTVRQADLVIVQRALEHKIVAQKLADYGVSPDQARLRLASLSDQELHQLASISKGLPSGGDGVGTVVALLVIIILVIVIVKLMNKEIVIR